VVQVGSQKFILKDVLKKYWWVLISFTVRQNKPSPIARVNQFPNLHLALPPTYLPTCLSTNLPSLLLAYLCTYIPAYLPIYLHAYLPTYMLTYLPTHLLTTYTMPTSVDGYNNMKVLHRTLWPWFYKAASTFDYLMHDSPNLVYLIYLNNGHYISNFDVFMNMMYLINIMYI
jgi:hypothetical protein